MSILKTEILSRKTVISNPGSLHGYAAWPTVARLQNGRLALTASAFRINHVCPFGKCVICFSEDEGRTWTMPAPVIDTPLDDRDGGVTAFGEKDVIVTSFNNSIGFQRDSACRAADHCAGRHRAYVDRYLDIIEQEYDWKPYLGSTCRISHDCGITFGEIRKLPVSSPHGPAALPDGSLLLVGTSFWDRYTNTGRPEKALLCYRMGRDGTLEKRGEIGSISEDLSMHEPHAIVLPDGTILVHIRVQGREKSVFTIFQSESSDGGYSFTKPHQLLKEKGGAPAHLILDKDVLISVYGYRQEPYGIRAMFSRDLGKTWETDRVLVDDGVSWDLGYPASVVLKDGSILTVYYARPGKDAPSEIIQLNWKYRFEE